jgi:hypothetical protein
MTWCQKLRRLAGSRLTIAVFAVVLAATISGCNSDQPPRQQLIASQPTATWQNTSAPPDLDPAVVADLQELLAATPQRIADDVNTLGLTQAANKERVESVALRLCIYNFSANVTIDWLQEIKATPSLLLEGPAKRLLRLSGNLPICPRKPTSEERDNYQRAMSQFLNPMPTFSPSPSGPIPRDVQVQVCQFLDSKGGGAVVETAIEALISTVSRKGVDTDEFIPLLVQIAGISCKQWLPLANAALEKHR